MVGKLLSVLVAHWAGVVDMKKYVVDLSKEERKQLEAITTKGESKARRLRRAHILLLADEGLLALEQHRRERCQTCQQRGERARRGRRPVAERTVADLVVVGREDDEALGGDRVRGRAEAAP